MRVFLAAVAACAFLSSNLFAQWPTDILPPTLCRVPNNVPPNPHDFKTVFEQLRVLRATPASLCLNATDGRRAVSTSNLRFRTQDGTIMSGRVVILGNNIVAVDIRDSYYFLGTCDDKGNIKWSFERKRSFTADASSKSGFKFVFYFIPYWYGRTWTHAIQLPEGVTPIRTDEWIAAQVQRTAEVAFTTNNEAEATTAVTDLTQIAASLVQSPDKALARLGQTLLTEDVLKNSLLVLQLLRANGHDTVFTTKALLDALSSGKPEALQILKNEIDASGILIKLGLKVDLEKDPISVVTQVGQAFLQAAHGGKLTELGIGVGSNILTRFTGDSPLWQLAAQCALAVGKYFTGVGPTGIPKP